MTPNLTVSYMAAEAARPEAARRAARGWQADQAVSPQERRAGAAVAALGRRVAALGALVAGAAPPAHQAPTAPRREYAG